MRIGMLQLRLRVEERMLVEAFEARGVAVEPIDLRTVVFDLADGSAWRGYDLILDRSISLMSSLAAVRTLEAFGVRCVNPARAIEVCADKLRTTLALEQAGIPTARTRIAVSEEAALDAIEALGYPVVLKPTIGSWGRQVSRLNDRDAAEAVLEHRAAMSAIERGPYYIQEHIDKPGRDIRVFVVGGEAIAAIERRSAHWRTNTATGGQAAGLPVEGELRSLSERAAACSGGDILAIDLLECPRRGLLVSEINHSMEFRNSVATTGVDIAGLMADHVLRLAAGAREAAA